MIDSLPPACASLARDTMAWCDRFWDDERALSWAPPGSGAGRVHLVPQSAWYAYGLLMRAAPGDVERAERCLDALLALQYDEPGTAWHGSFARFAETGPPPPDAVMWVHYDPNWRQFLGTSFLALLQDFEGRLDPERVRRIESALRLAVEGEPPERVPASYSNIALMKAFLEVEAGARLGEPRWLDAGEALAREVADGYHALGAFEEYNSPTYYGVDLFALALWSERSSSRRLRTLGRELESALWRDLARWYHPGLRNLCGPYSRSYGMDMNRYVALLGLWLWAAAGRQAAPLPPLEDDVEHGHDLFLGPLAAALGVRVPDEVLPELLRFPGEHAVEQRISTGPERVATGWLSPRVMIGAERSPSDRHAAWFQFVAASLHWQLPGGGVGWLSARSLGPPAARASAGALCIDWPASPRGGELRLRVHAPGHDEGAFASERWRLPGLELAVRATGLHGPRVERSGPEARLAFTRAAADGPARLELRVV